MRRETADVVFRSVLMLLLTGTLIACSDDPAASPGATASPSSTTAPAGELAPTSVPSVSTALTASTAPLDPGTTTLENALPERCIARVGPMYPNPVTERWVPSPESGDVIDDFARLVLGWPDVVVADQRVDGPVTLISITTSAALHPVELVVVPDADGRPASVCSARSVLGDEWAASMSIRGRDAVSGFSVWVDLDHDISAAVHELLPDVVSAQLLVSHGPYVQQVAATDPEQAWTFELDHPTTAPGWQLAFWRDADGAALAVVDTGLPAGDFVAG